MDDAARRRLRVLKKSASYVKAYEDVAFLNRDELRPVRLQLELLKPELIQSHEGIESTIVVFGGTRVRELAEIQQRVSELERKAASRPRDKELARQLKVARRLLAKAHYYDEARKF